MNECNFWKIRAKRYNRLEWVSKQGFIDEFMKMACLSPKDIVLDVGTGTGIIANLASKLTRKVVGIDISPEMMKDNKSNEKLSFVKADVRNLQYKDGTFDKVTARYVFHHILEGTQKAMDECYRVLKKGGRMVFAEGIPPSRAVLDDFIEIFKLKEERLTFMREDMIRLMKNSGFAKLQTKTMVMRRMSVRNWLENSGLTQAIQERIYQLHSNGSDVFKKAYNLKEHQGDCLIDMKLLVVGGIKVM